MLAAASGKFPAEPSPAPKTTDKRSSPAKSGSRWLG